MNRSERSARTVLDVLAERERQNVIWGEQNHPDGSGPDRIDNRTLLPWRYLTVWARETCQAAAADGTVTWLDIAREEVFEAFAEDDPAQLRTELIQASAVFLQWAEAIDRRLNP